jgi:hypothetical protein
MICWTVVQTRVPANWFKSQQLNIRSKDLQAFLIINNDHFPEHHLPNILHSEFCSVILIRSFNIIVIRFGLLKIN